MESLLYNWLRQQIMLFVSARVVSNTEVNEEKWIRLKEKIHDAALANGEVLTALEGIAKVRLKNSMKDYLDICREKFPLTGRPGSFLDTGRVWCFEGAE